RKAALLAHQLTHVDGVAATCTEGGVKEYWTCSACGGIFSDAEGKTQITEADLPVAALGHAYGDWVPLDENQHQRVCAHDEDHFENADHIWDAGVVTKEATEAETGVKTFTCSVCGGTKIEVIPMIDKDPITPSDAAADQAPVDKSIPTVNTGKIKTTANIKKKQMTVRFPVNEAVGNYRIQYRLAGKTAWTNAWSAGTDKYVIKGLKKASLCEFRIAGYVKQADGSWARGEWSKSAYRYMGAVSLKTVKSAKKKQLTVTWAKDAKSTGYQIQYSLRSNMSGAKTVTVKGKATTKYTIKSKSLKSGKKYYVKVRPISKKSGNTYIGSLSKAKSTKVK
ncbi:MAG: hypothetical protein IJJ21_02285, partial [Firmicutes bacterium]|nr:hypothetical protein [Bacillota bacterium]